MPIAFTIERSGRTFKARADGGTPFFVGFQTSYHDKKTGEEFAGLFNVPTQALPKILYDAAFSRGQYGFWADFIAPTALCEGNSYLTLNTYDRAKFTWGFGQFAAHVPNGDFVLFFRDLLQRPEAATYFPDLLVEGDRILRMDRGNKLPLETDRSTSELMSYLNPTTAHVEDSEVIAGAKFIHWTTNELNAQSLQVKHMIAAFQKLMRAADQNLDLDGKTADVCLVCCDILHQGRARYDAMRQALRSSNPLNQLLLLGSISYKDRISTLRAAVKKAGATLTRRHWNRGNQDFI